MAFFSKKSNIVFSLIILVLVVALGATSYFAYDRYTQYKQITANLSNNGAAFTAAQQKINEYTAKIAEYDSKSAQDEKVKTELEEKLQAALQEKERLQQEKNQLQSQLQELTVRKELQQQIALNNINQADVATGGICYLTFDDGPSANTIKILDILDSYGIKATFFVAGTGNKSYLQQITARGHAIGLHTATHEYDKIYKDINSYLTDIKQISNIVYNATGVRSNIMRFPGGSSNAISANYCEGIMTDLVKRMPMLGYSYFDWNVTSGDADAPRVPAKTLVNNVLTRAKGQKSICVLMHDNAGKTTTVDALPDIIEGLDALGYRFAPITAETYGFHHKKLNN